MGTSLFFACLLLTFLYWDVMLRVRCRLGPRTAFRFLSGFQHSSSRRVIGLARVWGGLRTTVGTYRGKLPPQCLVICNHQSLADIPILMYALKRLDLRFVAKQELRRFVPAVSVLLRKGQHALIGRKTGRRAALRALHKLASLARRGVSPLIFPEGNRSRTGALKTFNAGAFRIIAESSGLPILCVAVDGGARISRMKGVIRNLRGTRYRVQPLKLYPPATGRTEVARTLQAAREEIAACLERWRSGPQTAAGA